MKREMQTTRKKVINWVLGLTYAPCIDTYTNTELYIHGSEAPTPKYRCIITKYRVEIERIHTMRMGIKCISSTEAISIDVCE